jgi:hypothetical protein
MPVAALASCLVLLEVRFSRLLLAGACLFLVVGPVIATDTSGSLHGGEIIIVLHILSGLLSWIFAVPGLLLWRRRDSIPPPPAI